MIREPLGHRSSRGSREEEANEWYGTVELARDDSNDQTSQVANDLPQFLWRPNSEPTEHPGPQAGKLKVKYAPDRTAQVELNLRCGLVLSKSCRSRAAESGDPPKRGVFIPGYSNRLVPHARGELVLDYRRLPGNVRRGRREGSYRIHECWSIDLDLSTVLAMEFANVDKCSASLGHRTREKPIDAATRLLAEVLGVRPTDANAWDMWTKRPKDPPDQGEIIFVKYSPGSVRIPSLVVSPPELNRHADLVVVLQCVPYHPNDETDAEVSKYVVPIGPTGRLAGVEGAWTLQPNLLRGIWAASLYYERTRPDPICLERTRFERIRTLLWRLYA